MKWQVIAASAAAALCAAWSAGGAPMLVVGSKAFTESVILGEIATQTLRSDGLSVRHQRELGGSTVLWDALRAGQIDAYPEYTGTIAEELLAQPLLTSFDQLRQVLAPLGIGLGPPLGFADTYVLGVRADTARRLRLGTISDLRGSPQLRAGFSNEFMGRSDGWTALRQYYHLPQSNVRGMDHELAYRGLASQAIDITDFYSTDPEIARHGFVALIDDQHYFADYRAAFLYRAGLPASAVAALARLGGRITVQQMAQMNAAVTLDHQPESLVAARFLGAPAALAASDEAGSLGRRLLRRTSEHVTLTAVSLVLALLLGIPLGILSARRESVARLVLGATGLVQTIPTLALLVFMIPALGLGFTPAIAALSLYGLLPIVRGTTVGLLDINPGLRETATAMGLSAGFRLHAIELRLAARSIIGGIKTAAVIDVGTATLGALVGAGGYGQAILTGIRLNNFQLILEGAIPAALLAMVVELLFDLLERWVLAGRSTRLPVGQ